MPFNRNDKRFFWIIVVLFSTMYFAGSSGITTSNDGSHYALTRALADDHSFEISPYIEFAEHRDFALNGSRLFSDRPPGTALITAIFYSAGKLGPPQIAPMPSKQDAGNLRLAYALMVPALSSAGTLALVYFTLRNYLRRSPAASLITILVLGLGTLLFKYASILFSHAPAAFVAMATLVLLFELEHRTRHEKAPAVGLAFLLGFATAANPVMEYTSFPFSVIIGAYLLVMAAVGLRAAVLEPEVRRAWWLALGLFAAGAAIPIVFQLIYNTMNFGGPFEFSTFHVDMEMWPENRGLAAALGGSVGIGLMYQLVYWDYHQGLFLMTPVALFGLLGWVTFVRLDRRRALLIAALFLTEVLLFSLYTVPSNTFDSRYIAPFLPLCILPTAFWYDKIVEHVQGVGRVLWSFVFYGLLTISIVNQVLNLAFSLHYGGTPANLVNQGAMPPNLTYIFGLIYRNVPNIPLILLVEAVGAVILLGITRLGAMRRAARSTAPAEENTGAT